MTVPEILTRTAKVMAGFQPAWVLCGGWAVDAWLGRETRAHLDVDLAIALEDQRAVLDYLDHLDGWHVRGHDDEDDATTEQWNGRRLAFPGHIHATSPDGLELDIQLELWHGNEWELTTEPSITVPISQSTRPTPWGLPAATPEIVLFYKASERPRANDDQDFHALPPSSPTPNGPGSGKRSPSPTPAAPGSPTSPRRPADRKRRSAAGPFVYGT